MRKLFIRYVNENHIIWRCSTSSNTQAIRKYSPQSGGNGGDFDFLVGLQASDKALYLQLTCLAGASLQMTGGNNFFRLYELDICDHCPPPPPPPLRGMLRTLILSLQFPIVTTLWGQLAGKTMTVLPCSLLLYCTARVAYVYQTPTFPPHYEENVKVKWQHICESIPALLRGLGEAVVTNDWCIIYSLCCTSHENLVFSHTPTIYWPQTQNMTTADIFSTYFQVHSRPITSFSLWH